MLYGYDSPEAICGELMEENRKLKAEAERLQKEKDNLIKTYGECMTEAIKEFVKRFERKIKDVQFTLGQTWEIQHALKATLKEMEESE